MINLTSLLCRIEQPADSLRYGRGHGAPRSASERRPVVVWNITRRCNLKCVHCYSDSTSAHFPGELDAAECDAVLQDLAGFGVPAVLLSGGEPMIHPRFFEIVGKARALGLRVTVSSNGTLLDRAAAEKLKALSVSYVGISLDGIGETHDRFRGRTGAFGKAVNAFRLCREVGQKVGLRLTLTRQTFIDLNRILDFIEEEDVPRVCFYHLVYSGRGVDVAELTHKESRQALDTIMERTVRWHREGRTREVLTVDQPADAAYLLMHLDRSDPGTAAHARELLSWNGGGGNSSGVGIGNIDTQGNVHPDQFWHAVTLGNVRERPFSQIWTQPDHPVIEMLRRKRRPVEGRCAECRWFSLCGGGFRARAWQRFGDPWAQDPGCYLSDCEIKAEAAA